MPHVPDIHVPQGGTPDRRRRQDARIAGNLICGLICDAVRGFRRNGRCCGSGLRSGAACQGPSPDPVDSGSTVAPGNWATASSGTGNRAAPAAAGKCSACRCADRGGRGTALQGAVGGGGRDLGRSARIEFHRDETSGAAGRGGGRALLADPAWRHSRSQRGAGSLADRFAALGPQSRRCPRPRRSALAVGAVSLARQAARPLGGPI